MKRMKPSSELKPFLRPGVSLNGCHQKYIDFREYYADYIPS